MSAVDFMLTVRQQRMLAALLLNPERQFGSNELVAMGGPGSGAGQRVLQQFEFSGIAIKAARGNQRLYSANRKHPIFAELRSVCLKTFGMADVVAKELAPFGDRIELAFVFGSIARGEDRPESDIDLMIVSDLDVFKLGEVLKRLEAVLGRRVDLNLHTSTEWASLREDRVIKSILAGPHIRIID
ncbi:DNA polymerase subunit beta [Rhizobium anhuiense]|uniref:DNA polymerase subunit beta n=1 Tax=Rhizobium anhuiense TaxID=1184720 RepID=A0ABX4J4D6_9HYPH|nr:nucleotidyltransferase domain-containing protein [Rhizobium anhuiense]PDS49902.1 DNA polymerase subunit beta [Rhizobium anhuiense]